MSVPLHLNKQIHCLKGITQALIKTLFEEEIYMHKGGFKNGGERIKQNYKKRAQVWQKGGGDREMKELPEEINENLMTVRYLQTVDWDMMGKG